MTGPEHERRLMHEYPSPPEPFQCAPDDEELIERAQNEFFDAVMDSLGYTTAEAKNSFCKVRSREIIRENDVARRGNETEDRLTELLVHDRTVATVLKIRTDSNYTQAIFGISIIPRFEELLRFRYSNED